MLIGRSDDNKLLYIGNKFHTRFNDKMQGHTFVLYAHCCSLGRCSQVLVTGFAYNKQSKTKW